MNKENEDLVEFYKYSNNLSEQFITRTECFVKSKKSIRKWRKIFLSNVALYVVSDMKLKQRISLREISKIFIALFSSEFVIIYNAKCLLVDDFQNRNNIVTHIQAINSQCLVEKVNQTLLDDFLDQSKYGLLQAQHRNTKEIIDFEKYRKEFDFAEHKSGNIKYIKFQQKYQLDDEITKSAYWLLATVISIKKEGFIKDKRNQKQKYIAGFNEKEKKYTVKIYSKKLIGQNKSLLNGILRERKTIELVLSPYAPTLYKSFHTDNSIYLMCEYFRGYTLKHYLEKEVLKKYKLKSFLAQLVMGLGQIHQCNLVYNQINMDGILITEEGYILLYTFDRCLEVGEKIERTELNLEYISPEAFHEEGCSFGWDWWNLGNLIYEIKQGKAYNAETTTQDLEHLFSHQDKIILDFVKWKDEEDLVDLVKRLLEKKAEGRIGSKNDYHEILGHDYFKDIKKKSLTDGSCELIKRLIIRYPVASYNQGDEDWTILDSYLGNYDFNREFDQ